MQPVYGVLTRLKASLQDDRRSNHPFQGIRSFDYQTISGRCHNKPVDEASLTQIVA